MLLFIIHTFYSLAMSSIGSISTEHLPRPIEAQQAPKKRVDKEIVAHDGRVNMYRVWCGKRLGRRKWICMFELSMFF